MIKRLLFGLFTLSLVVIDNSSLSAETVALRADAWCPANCEPKSDKPGYMVEIAKAILEPAGITVDYQTVNWARAIADARAGTYAGIIGAAKTDAPDFIFPDNELGSSSACFYTKNDSKWSYAGADSLKAISLGVTKDYTYGEPLDGFIKSNPSAVQVLAGDDVLQKNVKMVEMGRTGAFIDDVNVVGYYFKQNNISTLKQVGCLEATPAYIAFSPANPNSKKYAKLLSDGMLTLRESGKLKAILERYGIKDWK